MVVHILGHIVVYMTVILDIHILFFHIHHYLYSFILILGYHFDKKVQIFEDIYFLFNNFLIIHTKNYLHLY